MGREGFGGFVFLHNIKSSSFGGTQKLYWRRVLEDLYEFFKMILCGYNILKIKNILIISIIYHSLKIHSLEKCERFLYFPIYFTPSESLPFPPLQTPKQSLGEIQHYCYSPIII